MKRFSKLLIFLCLLILTTTVFAGPREFYVFRDESVAASGTVTSGVLYVGDLEGDLTIKGTISSTSPDHSITFYAYRGAQYPDNDDIFTLSTADVTINATACTAETFSYPVQMEYTEYIIIKATNGAGKETATINLDLIAR